MASLFRRAGAAIAQILKSSADPAAVTGSALVYAKDGVGSVTQLFGRASDGSVTQLTPASNTLSPLSPIEAVPSFPISTVINDWTPTNWATSIAFDVAAADNEGTRITGAGALPGGTIRFLYNHRAQNDDAVVVLHNEDALSLAANRFATPDGATFNIPSQAGAILIYDATATRWRVLASGGRDMQLTTQQLAFFPDAQLSGVDELNGTYNDWTPTATNLQNTTFASGLGAAGGSRAWDRNTVWRVVVNAAGATITGMTTYTTSNPGGIAPVKIIINDGPGTLTLKNNDAGSSANNRLRCPANADIVLPQYGAAMLWMPSGRTWRVMALASRTDGTFAVVTPTEIRFPAITPAALGAGNNNNWNPAGLTTTTRVEATADAAGSTLTGMAGGTQGITNGAIRIIQNLSTTATITVTNQDANSNADNRFLLPGSVSLAIGPQGSATFVYRTTSSRWMCIGGTQT